MIVLAGRKRFLPAAVLMMACVSGLMTGCAIEPKKSSDQLINVISWSTASESDNFGFDVYRSETEQGPFVRISTEPLAGGGTTDLPRNYRFVDENIVSGQAYYYYVESISLSGQRQRFTPLMHAPPKYSGSH